MDTGIRGTVVKERDVRLDLGRCLAALSVVYIHFSLNFIPRYHEIHRIDWFAADIMQSVSRVCVPLFIMMSGALVIGRPVPDWGSYMRKRSSATLKPYAFGTIVYFVWYAANGVYPESAFSFLRQIVLGVGAGHLYFLFILLGMYIVSPLLQGIDNVSDRTLAGAIGALFVIDIIERLIIPWGLSLGYLALGNCMSYLPYFLIGYYVYHRRRIADRTAYLGFALSTFATAVLIWLVTSHPVAPYSYAEIMDYLFPTVVLQSFFAFNALLTVTIRPGSLYRAITWFAELTLGIYILQTIFVRETQWHKDWWSFLPDGVAILLLPIGIFLFTAGVVWALRIVRPIRGFV